jgi:hypothetical protein
MDRGIPNRQIAAHPDFDGVCGEVFIRVSRQCTVAPFFSNLEYGGNMVSWPGE